MATILLVDDDFDASDAMAQLLRQGGNQVRHVPDGHEALAAVVNSTFDLIILDLRMPVMDGLDFLAVMRSYHRLAMIPVVLFTAYYNDEAALRAEHLSVAKVFLKGQHDWGDMLTWIDEHLRSKQLS